MPTATVKKTRTKTPSKKSVKTPTVAVMMPGYFSFTKEVFQFLVQHNNIYWKLLVFGVVALYLISGISQQSYYSDLTSSTEEVSAQLTRGVFKGAVEVGALTASIMTGVLSGSLSESQQIYSSMFYLLLWLVTIWIIRHLSSNAKISFRDGLYSAGAPVISTLLVLAFGLLQLLPLAVFIWMLSLVVASGALSGIVYVILGVILALLLSGITLYWLIGTMFAAIIVTIPGTYPRAALRSAKELVSGHRPQILKRVLWLGMVCTLVALLKISFLVTIDAGLNYSLGFLVVPLVQVVTIALFIYAATYVYMLYRKVIDERA